jgi:predicted alpha/beta-hydrolase family hydrolase
MEQTLKIEAGERSVEAILLAPERARLIYVLAHGAGAGMRHPFLSSIAQRLLARDVATLRFQFPYMQAGGKRTDPPAVAEATVRAAILKARELLPDASIIAGGKSFGGRMTSQLLSHDHTLPVLGVVFLGFPLHAPNKPSRARAAHLFEVPFPMLFLQGTRDTLADLALIREVTTELADKATLHVVNGADHSFAVLKRDGRNADEVMNELADEITAWAGARQKLFQRLSPI